MTEKKIMVTDICKRYSFPKYKYHKMFFHHGIISEILLVKKGFSIFFSSKLWPAAAWCVAGCQSHHIESRSLLPRGLYYKIDKKSICIQVHECTVGAKNRNDFYDSVRKRKRRKSFA